jgi:hypothetical protein
MSKNYSVISIAAGLACAALLSFASSSAWAQRPTGQGDPQRPPQQPPPPPPPQQPPPQPQRPQPPPPPPPQDTTREQEARAHQQQEQQRIENARQEQNARDAKRIENVREQQREQERIANARKDATATDDAKNQEIIARLTAAERMHRDQLARINRLKQLALRQGQQDRIAELDGLLQRSNAAFDTELARAKGQLPPPEFARVQTMLEQGRRHDVKRRIGEEPAQRQRTAPADATRGTPPAPQRPKQ